MITPAGGYGLAVTEEAVEAVTRRQQQVLVVRRLHRPPVRCAEDGSTSRDGVGDAEARLDQGRGAEAIVVIQPDS